VKDSGAEILRLWVAASDFKEDVRISKDMLVRLSEAYRKFRNTARFMVGNLFDFSPAEHAVPAASLSEFDQWALRQTHQLLKRVYQWYEAYEFHRIYHAVNEFVTIDLSAFYLNILKDRLYTAAPNSQLRRSSQTAIHRILEALTRAMAPIYSFTCDEIWQYLPNAGNRQDSVHMSEFVPADELIEGFPAGTLEKLNNWDQLLQIREAVFNVLETTRKERFIGDSLQAKVQLEAKGKTRELLQQYRAFLPYLFIVSQVELLDSVQPGTYFSESESLKVVVRSADGKKCERCWNFSVDVGQDRQFETVCGRCSAVLREMGF
jgi:isoleucyl-tRNA synthetase